MSCICRNSGTFLCGGCKKQAYCSSACAKQDWQNDHQKACIGLKLQSKEGDVIEIDDEKISKIKTFQDLIEETGTSERALLLNFDTDTIQRIKLFAEMDNDAYFKLFRAADYLNYSELLVKLLPEFVKYFLSDKHFQKHTFEFQHYLLPAAMLMKIENFDDFDIFLKKTGLLIKSDWKKLIRNQANPKGEYWISYVIKHGDIGLINLWYNLFPDDTLYLDLAISSSTLDVVKYLVNEKKVSYRIEDIRTALFYGRSKILKFLVELPGMDLKAVTFDMLYRAALRGHMLDVISFLHARSKKFPERSEQDYKLIDVIRKEANLPDK